MSHIDAFIDTEVYSKVPVSALGEIVQQLNDLKKRVQQHGSLKTSRRIVQIHVYPVNGTGGLIVKMNFADDGEKILLRGKRGTDPRNGVGFDFAVASDVNDLLVL